MHLRELVVYIAGRAEFILPSVKEADSGGPITMATLIKILRNALPYHTEGFTDEEIEKALRKVAELMEE